MQDISGLENLTRQLFLEVSELHALRARRQEANTWRGKALNIIGYGLSVYCIYKLTMTTASIALGRVGQIDPVTRGFQLAVDLLGVDIDVKFWSQHVSFILVGIIIVTSMRTLLIRLTKVAVPVC